MAAIPNVRALSAKAMLDLAPPLMRETLLDDGQFWDELGFKVARILTFEDSGALIRRSELYEAIRQSLSGASELKVTDTDDRKWELIIERDQSESPTLAIFHNNQRIPLLPHVTLSSDKNVRLHSVNKIALDFNLPTSARDKWRDVVSERVLNDDEVDEFYNDFCDTPIHITRSRLDEFMNRRVSVSSLVPCSRRYYDRLVGVYDGSTSIRDYAAGAGRQFFEQLSSWRPYDGFLFSLLLSSHSSLTAEISVEHLGSEDLVRAFGFLGECGDRISQLGAIEVGLRVLPDRPDIQPALIRLIEQIRDDDADVSASGFKLLSALFLLVDGELSRTRLLKEQPPFYRRLAALSQAALICRQFANSSDATDSFCKWAVSSRGGHHYFQSLADMRLEPRWYPNYSEASQIKVDFYGRIVIAAMDNEQNIKGDELHDLVLGEDPGSIYSLSKFPSTFSPGPLEATENSLYIIPPEISKAIEAQLGAEEVGLSSFTALLNFAPIFRVELDQTELAEKVRDLGRILLANVEERSQLLSILVGLASVAAVTRGRALADELRILVRKCRRDAQYKLSVEEVLGVSLVAAASRENLNDWREFVGDCLTELAFGELEDDDRDVLHTHLQYLCHAVPDLWVTCSKADAALRALRGH